MSHLAYQLLLAHALKQRVRLKVLHHPQMQINDVGDRVQQPLGSELERHTQAHLPRRRARTRTRLAGPRCVRCEWCARGSVCTV